MVSSDPNSLAQLTVSSYVCVCTCRPPSRGGVFRLHSPLTFPICFRNVQKSSLGASDFLKHHFQASKSCCVAPHCPQTTHTAWRSLHCLAAFHTTAGFLQGKSSLSVKKMYQGYAFMLSVKKVGVGIKAVSEQGEKEKGLLTVVLQWYVCACPASYHTAAEICTNATRRSQAQIWLCSLQSIQCVSF